MSSDLTSSTTTISDVNASDQSMGSALDDGKYIDIGNVFQSRGVTFDIPTTNASSKRGGTVIRKRKVHINWISLIFMLIVPCFLMQFLPPFCDVVLATFLFTQYVYAIYLVGPRNLPQWFWVMLIFHVWAVKRGFKSDFDYSASCSAEYQECAHREQRKYFEMLNKEGHSWWHWKNIWSSF